MKIKIIKFLFEYGILILIFKVFLYNLLFNILKHISPQSKGGLMILVEYLLNFSLIISVLFLFFEIYDFLFDFLWNKLILKKKRFH